MKKSVWLFKRPTSDNWYLGWRENGKLKAASTGTADDNEAEKVKARHILKLGAGERGECPEMTVLELVREYDKTHVNNIRTVQLNHYSWTMWAKRHKFVGEINRENLVSWIQQLKLLYKPNGVSIHLRNLHKLIKFGIDSNYLLKSPFRRGDIPEKVFAGRFLTSEEKDRLLAACQNVELRRIVALNLCPEMGLRISQVCELDWSQYAVLGHVLKIPSQKRQKIRLIPLSDKALALMGPMRDEGLVFPGWNKDRLEHMFNRAVKRSGIRGRVRFHDLRHTAASDAVRTKKLTPPELRDLYGWSSIAQTDVYLHSHFDDIQKKINA